MNVAAGRTIRSVPPDLSTSEVKVPEVKEEGNLLIEAVSLLVQRQRETEGWVTEQIWQAEERAAAAERRYAELEGRLSGIEEHLSRLVNELEPQRGDAQVDERLSRLREQVEDLKTVGTDGRPATSPRLSSMGEAAHPEIDSRDVQAGPAAAESFAPAGGATASARAASAAADEARGVPGAVSAAAASEPGPRRIVEPPLHVTRIVGAPPRTAGPPDEVRTVAARRELTEPAVVGAPRPATTPSANVGFLELLGSSPADRWGVVLIGAGAVAVLYAVLTSLRFG
jgi:hypothetical protein